MVTELLRARPNGAGVGCVLRRLKSGLDVSAEAAPPPRLSEPGRRGAAGGVAPGESSCELDCELPAAPL